MAYSDEAKTSLTCPNYPWPYKGFLDSDDSSIRRGQQVFQQTCSSCHGNSLTSNRDLQGVKDEVKPMATEIMVLDRPDKKADRFANPPLDLSLITKAKNSSVFPLISGYRPSAGVLIGDGFCYNPYSLGGAITMLIGGAIE